jgi:CheY-like chemotaxis protein
MAQLPSAIPTLLLIGSPPILRKRIATMLGLRGIRVLSAASITQAFRTASGKSIHLILIDLDASGVDGVEVMKRCRQSMHLSKIPMVLMTSSAEPNSRWRECIDLGARQCLVKPLNETSFLKTVFQYIQPSAISIAH